MFNVLLLKFFQAPMLLSNALLGSNGWNDWNGLYSKKMRYDIT